MLSNSPSSTQYSNIGAFFFLFSGGQTGAQGGDGGGGPLAFAVTALAGIALVAAFYYTRRAQLKSPWSRKRRKPAVSADQWRSFFMPNGRLRDGGNKLLKKVRNGVSYGSVNKTALQQ